MHSSWTWCCLIDRCRPWGGVVVLLRREDGDHADGEMKGGRKREQLRAAKTWRRWFGGEGRAEGQVSLGESQSGESSCSQSRGRGVRLCPLLRKSRRPRSCHTRVHSPGSVPFPRPRGVDTGSPPTRLRASRLQIHRDGQRVARERRVLSYLRVDAPPSGPCSRRAHPYMLSLRASRAPSLRYLPQHRPGPRPPHRRAAFLRLLTTMSAQTVEITVPKTGKKIRVPTGLFINNEFVASVDSKETIPCVFPVHVPRCSNTFLPLRPVRGSSRRMVSSILAPPPFPRRSSCRLAGAAARIVRADHVRAATGASTRPPRTS